ncbi:MAG TPA: protein-L-isoaspartate(D-aspartate) O-methyltransferase [Woeseiaceae bacterium]
MLNFLARDNFTERRHAMVASQIAARGIRSAKVLDAMRAVPREAFVPEQLRDCAYQDSPLPIGSGQTISQPHIVAYMIDALDLKGGEKVLEIGAGSGYAAAVIGQIAGRVYSIERIGELADAAKATLAALGCDNVEVRHGDGTRGCPDQAPFDAIVVAAGARHVPKPLKRQLKEGGRLMIPVGRFETFQHLVRITRVSEDEFHQEEMVPVRFVPLISDSYH